MSAIAAVSPAASTAWHARAERMCAPFRDAYPFEPHFLELGASALHYIDEGPRDAPPLLCVHGNPSWSYLFRSLARSCADELRVIAPDHLGMGLSGPPLRSPARLEQRIEQLEALVLALDLERITLVVHDWGGPIGLSLALRQPRRIARVCVLNTAAFRSQRIPWRIAACRPPLLGELALLCGNGFARAALRMAVERPLGAQTRAAYLAPTRERANRRAILDFVRDIPLSERHPSYALLEQIERGLHELRHVPSSIVWGERDWCFTPHFRAEWQRRLPQAHTRVLERAGHWLLEDEPQAVALEVRALCARAPLR